MSTDFFEIIYSLAIICPSAYILYFLVHIFHLSYIFVMLMFLLIHHILDSCVSFFYFLKIHITWSALRSSSITPRLFCEVVDSQLPGIGCKFFGLVGVCLGLNFCIGKANESPPASEPGCRMCASLRAAIDFSKSSMKLVGYETASCRVNIPRTFHLSHHDN